jgi:hypothetical protein
VQGVRLSVCTGSTASSRSFEDGKGWRGGVALVGLFVLFHGLRGRGLRGRLRLRDTKGGRDLLECKGRIVSMMNDDHAGVNNR